jgi:hypothetical protein
MGIIARQQSLQGGLGRLVSRRNGEFKDCNSVALGIIGSHS